MRARLVNQKTVVRLAHFRFCSKHIALLMQLQIETPSLVLDAESPTDRHAHILVADLDLNYEELRFLNPAEAA